jgi:hypothetical protein
MTKNQLDNKTDSEISEKPEHEFAKSSNVLLFEPKKTTSHNADEQSVSKELDVKLVLLDQEFMKLSILIEKLKNITGKNAHE